jgi:hypothetical protein
MCAGRLTIRDLALLICCKPRRQRLLSSNPLRANLLSEKLARPKERPDSLFRELEAFRDSRYREERW